VNIKISHLDIIFYHKLTYILGGNVANEHEMCLINFVIFIAHFGDFAKAKCMTKQGRVSYGLELIHWNSFF
jgi:hypothetical protein